MQQTCFGGGRKCSEDIKKNIQQKQMDQFKKM
jgi:hypothetical protein